MSLQLKGPYRRQFPPGGFPFKDARTGFSVSGYEGTAQMNAVRVIAHRRSNPHVYPPSEGQWFDENSVAQEILQQKFTTNPELFVGQPDRIPGMVMHQPSAPALSAVCTCGANDWEPQFCRTCGGNKINGYKCRKCGHPRSK